MKLLGIMFILFAYSLNNIPKDLPPIPEVKTITTTRWNIPKPFSSRWNIPTNNKKQSKGKRPPKEVINYAKKLAVMYNIQAVAILAACYHERGIINWFDDWLCGFGAINNKPKTWNFKRFGGWKKQLTLFAKRSNRCGYFRKGVKITRHHAQQFAKNCYKTEAWQHYSKIADYVIYFSK